VQYCCAEYVDILNEDRIAISMTQSGNPYDNALAERVNVKMSFIQKGCTKIIRRLQKHCPRSLISIIQNGHTVVSTTLLLTRHIRKWEFLKSSGSNIEGSKNLQLF